LCRLAVGFEPDTLFTLFMYEMYVAPLERVR
jgi:hypothetical protein